MNLFALCEKIFIDVFYRTVFNDFIWFDQSFTEKSENEKTFFK